MLPDPEIFESISLIQPVNPEGMVCQLHEDVVQPPLCSCGAWLANSANNHSVVPKARRLSWGATADYENALPFLRISYSPSDGHPMIDDGNGFAGRPLHAPFKSRCASGSLRKPKSSHHTNLMSPLLQSQCIGAGNLRSHAADKIKVVECATDAGNRTKNRIRF